MIMYIITSAKNGKKKEHFLCGYALKTLVLNPTAALGGL